MLCCESEAFDARESREERKLPAKRERERDASEEFTLCSVLFYVQRRSSTECASPNVHLRERLILLVSVFFSLSLSLLSSSDEGHEVHKE